MKLFLKTSKLLLVSAVALFTITSQAMEMQLDEDATSFIDTLDVAIRHNNKELCNELFNNFQNNLITQEPVEQVHNLVEIIRHVVHKNAQLTSGFCTLLTHVYIQNPMLSLIMQEQISPLITSLKDHKNIDALHKISCIFSDNQASNEFNIIQAAIKNKIQVDSGQKEYEDDAQIARIMQEEWSRENHHNTRHNSAHQNDDEQLTRALLLSQQEYETNATKMKICFEPSAPSHEEISAPSAPPAEEFAEQDEEDALSKAIEESLAVPTAQPVQSQVTFLQNAAAYGFRALLHYYFGNNN